MSAAERLERMMEESVGRSVRSWSGVYANPGEMHRDIRTVLAENERLREAHALAFRWIAKQPEGRARSEATCAYVPADVYDRIAAAITEECE